MIKTKTQEEINTLKEGGKVLSSVLNALLSEVVVGVDTAYLNEKAIKIMEAAGGKPSFLGFQGFNSAICTCINEELVHAPSIPGRVLKEGDIFTIDIGMEYKGLFTDMAQTVAVGKPSKEAKKLMKVTKECLALGIKAVKEGNSLYDIGYAISKHAEKNGFSVIRELVGHGVGYAVHEDPQIPNYPLESLKSTILKKGMVIALEPMLSLGRHEVVVGADKWTVSTADKSLSAQEEHTLAIGHDGKTIILTN